MLEELKTEEETKTRDSVERPSDKCVIPVNLVYKIETKADRSLEKYKGQYVGEGLKQIVGIDYGETFASTTKPETFNLILSIAAKKFRLTEMNVKSFYFYAKIKEQSHLEQTQSFEKKDEERRKFVCSLEKSFYGLKRQAKTGMKNWRQSSYNKT